jgi:hypothetical protein
MPYYPRVAGRNVYELGIEAIVLETKEQAREMGGE